MTLEQFCAALASSTMVTVVDSDGNELIKFFSSGYLEIDSALLERKVEKLMISKKLADASCIAQVQTALPPSA